VKKPATQCEIVDGQCAGPAVCPLARVKAGSVVCIKQLVATPDVTSRLRELGLGEDQKIKLLMQQDSVICQVCNSRVAISQELAEAILVETVA
jgi:Fe2+ transport system protein FeoA